MIGDMIARIRKEKKITKTKLAEKTNINIGHLTHIEKGERNPSHKALRSICKALDVPYQPLMYTYDKFLSDDQEFYKAPNHISYNKILAVDSIHSFMECPTGLPSAALAIKMPDNSMEPKLPKDVYVFVELNSPLNNREIGVFDYDGKVLIRRFIVRRDKLVLRADNKDMEEISIYEGDNFNIIGKVIGTNTGLIL